MEAETLYWSTRGEVACLTHAPSRTDPRWVADRWARVPRAGRVLYQCQHCEGTPVRHTRRAAAEERPAAMSPGPDVSSGGPAPARLTYGGR